MGSVISNSFGTRTTLSVDGESYEICRLDAVDGSARLPYSLKVLLENLLRNEDGRLVSSDQINALAQWDPAAEHGAEIQYTPTRVLLQDFTGVPCVVDLVAMRDAMVSFDGDPQKVNPLIPSELVIDHSVIADSFGASDSFKINAELEFHRNQERYQLLRWAQQWPSNPAEVTFPHGGGTYVDNLEPGIAQEDNTRERRPSADLLVDAIKSTTLNQVFIALVTRRHPSRAPRPGQRAARLRGVHPRRRSHGDESA